MRKPKEKLLFPVLFCFPAINYYIAQILYAFGIVNPLSEVFYSLIFLSGMLVYFSNTNLKVKIPIYLFIALNFIISFNLTDGIWDTITGPIFIKSLFVKFVFIYLPITLILSSSNIHFGELLQSLLPAAIVVNVLCSIAFAFQIINLGILQEYMTFAYTALPSILLGVYYGFFLKKKVLLIVSLMASATVVFGGSRGAILTLLLFLSFVFQFNISKRSNRIVVFISTCIILLNFSFVLSYVKNVFISYGYESRFFTLVENEKIMESEGRYMVYKKAISIIDYFGHGVFSDRVLLQNVSDSTYCHNWILEILVNFGWIFGLLIVLFLIFFLFKLIKKRPSNDVNYTFMIYFSLTMLLSKYMLSGSYLDSSECALIAGWLIYCGRNK